MGVEVTPCNCCVWCLLSGVKAVESLWHVVFECPEYEPARVNPEIRSMLLSGSSVFEFHRGRWSWCELRSARSFFLDLVRMRAAALGRQRCKASALQELVDTNWFE